MYFSVKTHQGIKGLKRYVVLTHSYWDKNEKKYKKKRMHLGEHPILTPQLKARISMEWGIEKIQENTEKMFESEANTLYREILQEIKPGRIKASKKILNQVNDLNSAYPEALEDMGIRIHREHIMRTRGLSVISLSDRYYVVRQEEGHCLRYFQNGKYCPNLISEVVVRGAHYPFCEKHRKEKAGMWTEKEWDEFKSKHSSK